MKYSKGDIFVIKYFRPRDQAIAYIIIEKKLFRKKKKKIFYYEMEPIYDNEQSDHWKLRSEFSEHYISQYRLGQLINEGKFKKAELNDIAMLLLKGINIEKIKPKK